MKKTKTFKTIILTLLDDLEAHCDETIKKDKGVKRDAFSLGYVVGEQAILHKLKQLIKGGNNAKE